MNTPNGKMGRDFDNFSNRFVNSEFEHRLPAFLRLTREQHVGTFDVADQSRIRECLQSGIAAQCHVTLEIRGSVHRYLLEFTRTTDGRLTFPVSALPCELVPLSLTVLRPVSWVTFPPSVDFPFPVIVRPAVDKDTGLPRRSSNFIPSLSASSYEVHDDDYDTEISMTWDDRTEASSKNLRVELTTEANFPEQVYAVAELFAVGKPYLLAKKAIYLTQSARRSDVWVGRCCFPRPESTVHIPVKIRVRAATRQDSHLWDASAAVDLSETNLFLAEETFDAHILRRVSDNYVSTPWPSTAIPTEAPICLTVAARKEMTGDEQTPFDEAASATDVSEIDGGLKNNVNRTMAACRKAWMEGQEAVATEFFWNAVVMLQSRHRRRLRRLMRQSDRVEDLLCTMYVNVFEAYRRSAASMTDENPFGYFDRALTRILHRWQDRERRREDLSEMDVSLPVKDQQPYSMALQSAQVIRDQFWGAFTVPERAYFDLLFPADADNVVDKDKPQRRPRWAPSRKKHERKDWTDAEILRALPATLEFTPELLRSLRVRLKRKLKVLNALDELPVYASPDEIRYLHCQEVRALDHDRLGLRQREKFVRTELGIDEIRHAKLQASAVPKLDFLLGVNWLLNTGACDPHEADFLKAWCLQSCSDEESHRRFGFKSTDERAATLAIALQAAILLEQDWSRHSRLEEPGKTFLEVICVDRESEEVLLQQLRPVYPDKAGGGKTHVALFDKPDGTFQGSLQRLREHVRALWTEANTLVPIKYLAWNWD